MSREVVRTVGRSSNVQEFNVQGRKPRADAISTAAL